MATRKYNYFDAIEQLMEYSCQAAKYLDSCVSNFSTELLPSQIEEMHKIEHAADEKHHEITNVLFKEFLPPIEREDIIEIAAKTDDITDCIDDVMQHFYLYDVDELIPECKEFSVLIMQCCVSVYSIAKEFHNFRKSSTIRESIVKTHNLESEGDLIYSRAIRRIFTSNVSDKELFTWARIISSLEDCCDYCEHVAGLFEKAIMKNS